jgi:dTMP kinase
MIKNSHPGKFIIFEGIDSSGKSIQTKLLERRLKNEGYKAVKIDFPQYGAKSAGLVEEYLNGKYGAPEEVGPYRASIFYACDRYDASFKIRKWLAEGKIIISDRYIASNIGHQGGKIRDKKERKHFLKWLYNLEYNIFKIPKPDFTFILKISSDVSFKLSHKVVDKKKKKKRAFYLGNKKRDIHEKDISHLKNAFNSYLEISKEFPKEFNVIECIKDKKLLPPQAIHQEIWEQVKKFL